MYQIESASRCLQIHHHHHHLFHPAVQKQQLQISTHSEQDSKALVERQQLPVA